MPAETVLHYPGGLSDYLTDATADTALLVSTPFAAQVELDGQKFEWAITWLGAGEDGFFHSYCNTVPTPSGGTHEAGFRQAITRALRSFGDLAGNRKAADITADDVFAGTAAMLSVFLSDPQFQGQTKDRLVSADATRLTEQAARDRFEQWLSADAARAQFLSTPPSSAPRIASVARKSARSPANRRRGGFAFPASSPTARRTTPK